MAINKRVCRLSCYTILILMLLWSFFYAGSVIQWTPTKQPKVTQPQTYNTPNIHHLFANKSASDIIQSYFINKLLKDSDQSKMSAANKLLKQLFELVSENNNGTDVDITDDLVHIQGTGQLLDKQHAESDKAGEAIDTLQADVKDHKNEKATKIRVGIIVYMPYRSDQLYEMEFLSYMHPSWKYVTTHKTLKQFITLPEASNVPDMTLDLITYCHPKSCCTAQKANCKLWTKVTLDTDQSDCYYHPDDGFPEAAEYHYYNTFAFLRDDNFMSRAKKYDWLIRSDLDVFIGPAVLGWLPKYEFMSGGGGYASEFNRKRIPEVAARLNLTHHGITNVGSTWYGKPDIFMKISQLTLKYTKHFYKNEFNKTLDGIQHIMNKSSVGEWPTWWRPVSLLYGGEVAINHAVPDFDISRIADKKLDYPSSSKLNILSYPHLHCWHGDEEFQKFRFTTKLRALINGGTDNRTTIYKSDQDVKNMTVRDYCTFIAWNAVANNNIIEHLQKPADHCS
ncbi:unnamed protein product [Owenia fusiformis]|uniref:DUF7164 domain-containing protein n=1 Tax=Owenia fusiformis TaxID=6347 RepID=A0A8S4Q117_OWEFU|nr:unnamed protein product [Owenia fusiformis]